MKRARFTYKPEADDQTSSQSISQYSGQECDIVEWFPDGLVEVTFDGDETLNVFEDELEEINDY